MRKSLIASFTGLILLMVAAAPATADSITLSLNPASQAVNPGSSLSVAVVVSGLGAFSAPSLGVYDLDVLFDPTILALTGVTFGDPGLGNQLDLLGLGSLAFDTPGTGFVNLFELSFDSPFDLDTLQADSFTLATLNFMALGSGTSPLTISINALGDSLGGPLTAQVQSGSVTVVPEPGTLVLLGTGLAALVARRRRQKEAARIASVQCG